MIITPASAPLAFKIYKLLINLILVIEVLLLLLLLWIGLILFILHIKVVVWEVVLGETYLL